MIAYYDRKRQWCNGLNHGGLITWHAFRVHNPCILMKPHASDIRLDTGPSNGMSHGGHQATQTNAGIFPI